MQLTVNAFMQESNGITPEQLEQLETFAGKNAGISQLRDGYYNTSVSDPEKALARFMATTKMGHTSIAGHAQVEIIFEHASRMMAMVMNSLQCYTTTEKSGRYTEMTGNDASQCALYDKWNSLFRKHIMEIYPDYNDAFITKQLKAKGISGFVVKNGRIYAENSDIMSGELLDITKDSHVASVLSEIMDNPRLPVNTHSQENARYILSIFTKSTTFGYTASLEQWNFIYDWLVRFLEQIPEHMKDGKRKLFAKNMYEEFATLAAFIKENLYCEHIRDHKKRGLDMLTDIFDPDHPMKDYDAAKDERIGFSYLTDYHASFIVLSHLHRHRTLKYWMRLDPDMAGFYVPLFIRDTPLEKEWLHDMESVRHLLPQGMLINIIEAGTLDNFALKTSERYCGRAMLETMNVVKDLGLKFVQLYENGQATEMEKAYIRKFYNPESGKLRTKATITDGCREGCYFGCVHALDRLI